MRKTAFVSLMLLVLLAFADIRFSIGGRGIFTISLFEMWAYATVLPMLACLHLARNLKVPPTKWLFLYLAWAWVPVFLFWDNPDYAIQMDLKSLVPGALAYVFLLMAVEGGGEFHLVQKCWISAGAVNACMGVLQYMFGGPHPVKIAETAFEKLDLHGKPTTVFVTGFYSHPNSFAQIMIPWFVVAAVIWLTSRRFMTWRSWGWLLISVLFGVTLLMSMAKGALLWSLAGILTGVVMAKWNRARSMFTFTAAWAVLVAAIIATSLFLVGPYGLHSLSTLGSRVEFITAGWRLFLDNPVNAALGGGIRLWEDYAYNYAQWQFNNAHNVYINQALMYGGIGVLLLVAFIASAVRYALKTYKDSPGAHSPFPYIGAALAMTGEYFFEPSFSDPIQKYQLFFVLAAVILTGARLRPRGRVMDTARTRTPLLKGGPPRAMYGDKPAVRGI